MDAQHYLLAAPAVTGPKLYWFNLSFGLGQQKQKGDTEVWAAQHLDINPSRTSAQTGEDTPVVSQGSGTTRNKAVYQL